MLMLLSTVEGNDKKDKFLDIYEAYKLKVFNMANRILNDSYLAEDVSQEVFVILSREEILEKIDEIDSAETKSYIGTITNNTAINLFNKRKREQNISITDKNVQIVEEKDACDNTLAVIRKLGLEDLIINIKKLPRKYYIPILLKYLHELSDKEMAIILDIEETTVRKRIERAKKQLRCHYESNRSDIDEEK